MYKEASSSTFLSTETFPTVSKFSAYTLQLFLRKGDNQPTANAKRLFSVKIKRQFSQFEPRIEPRAR